MTYDDFLAEWRDPDRGFITARTSGSTGTPKLIELPKGMLAESAERTNEFFSIGRDSLLHSCISPDFIGGKMMAVRAELAGCRFSYEEPSNRPSILLGGKGHGRWPDLISVVASQMEYIILNFQDIPSTVNFIIGGSAIHPDLRRAIEDSGVNAWESYGMTETASHIALRRVRRNPDEVSVLYSSDLSAGSSNGFTPMRGISVSLDERDCLCIDLPHFGRIATNDLAEISEDGSFQILGRADNVIISGGKKIIPEEVESVLLPLLKPLGITRIAVSSLPDVKWGEATVLAAEYPEIDSCINPVLDSELDSGLDSNIDSRQLIYRIRELAKSSLEGWKVPKHYLMLREVPLTANGKIDRNRLRDMLRKT